MGGALLDEVVAIARDPRVIVRVLGCQVPVVAVYFMQSPLVTISIYIPRGGEAEAGSSSCSRTHTRTHPT